MLQFECSHIRKTQISRPKQYFTMIDVVHFITKKGELRREWNLSHINERHIVLTTVQQKPTCFVLISADAQSQLATAQEKERASTERSIELSSKVASLESQVVNYRQEKSRIEAEFELDKAKLEALEDFKSR